MSMELAITPDLGKEESNLLREKLDESNSPFVGPSNFREIGLAIRDESGSIVGGLIGSCVWNLLHVNVVWVSGELRGKGYGSKLLAAAEKDALKRGCDFVKLHTFSFQARPFYERHGYRVIAETKGFPEKGQSQFLMFKELR